ncbi:MAG: hypothetical protein KBD64_01075 [Gammaproteobacteria bacterium]|nr:hypothetical protein [Gammaproteobacteria bacterium]
MVSRSEIENALKDLDLFSDTSVDKLLEIDKTTSQLILGLMSTIKTEKAALKMPHVFNLEIILQAVAYFNAYSLKSLLLDEDLLRIIILAQGNALSLVKAVLKLHTADLLTVCYEADSAYRFKYCSLVDSREFVEHFAQALILLQEFNSSIIRELIISGPNVLIYTSSLLVLKNKGAINILDVKYTDMRWRLLGAVVFGPVIALVIVMFHEAKLFYGTCFDLLRDTCRVYPGFGDLLNKLETHGLLNIVNFNAILYSPKRMAVRQGFLILLKHKRATQGRFDILIHESGSNIVLKATEMIAEPKTEFDKPRFTA